MRFEIDAVLDRSGGAASRRTLLEAVSRTQLDDEVARRHLVALFPRAYCRPWDVDDPRVREHAAVASIGAPVALSHLSALRRRNLPVPAASMVHVIVPGGRHPIGRVPELRVHRTRLATPVSIVRGVRTVAPALAIVQSWPLVPGSDQRAAAIDAVRRGIVTVDELRVATDQASRLSGRARLITLIDALGAGCESELELWGYLEVFDVPGLRHAVRQKPVHVRGRTYRLDLAYDDERVAVELDGRAYHSSSEARERDMRRDAALSAAGWVTLRFSHHRLHHDIAGCRRDTLATLSGRRQWRRSG